MKAIALTQHLPIDDPQSLFDIELPEPAAPTGHDVLVRIEAVSVNPVDAKVRAAKLPAEAQPKVLGYDAVGVIEALGEQAVGFKVGNRVYYAGDLTRSGTNAQRQLVDARLIGHAPQSLDAADAVALPLTSLTVWELLFQRMPFDSEHGGAGKSLLIIAGAGGVGSIAIQLAKRAGFTVIATASRPETTTWCQTMGAHHVINHRQPLPPQLLALGFAQVDVVLNFTDPAPYWTTMGEILAPQGHVGLIVEPTSDLNISDPYKAKCIGIHWEMMFARSRYKTADQAEQGRILKRVAKLVDAGELRSTRSENLGRINAQHLREAHRRMESGDSIGKLVLAGW